MRTLPAKENVRAVAVTSAVTPRRSLKGKLYLRTNTEKKYEFLCSMTIYGNMLFHHAFSCRMGIAARLNVLCVMEKFR